jgi:hypothetical protein
MKSLQELRRGKCPNPSKWRRSSRRFSSSPPAHSRKKSLAPVQLEPVYDKYGVATYVPAAAGAVSDEAGGDGAAVPGSGDGDDSGQNRNQNRNENQNTNENQASNENQNQNQNQSGN